MMKKNINTSQQKLLGGKAPVDPNDFNQKTGVLIHDNTIFDGVDERQVAKALGTAAVESQREGFQYICALNTDHITYNDFSHKFRDQKICSHNLY